MEDNLLKLDMLGHDDPTMIRMLENLTGVNARADPPGRPGHHVHFHLLQGAGL
jgi:DNA polymerase-3 subunit alpha (Gram-positive type)